MRQQKDSPFRKEEEKPLVNAEKWEQVATGRILNFKTGRINTTPMQAEFAEERCRLLNKEIALGGKWRTVWTNPRQTQDWLSGAILFDVPEMLEAQYLDLDGNPLFVWEAQEDIYTLLGWGVHSCASQCFKAFSQYDEMMKAVDVKPEQRSNIAKGEAIDNSSMPDIVL